MSCDEYISNLTKYFEANNYRSVCLGKNDGDKSKCSNAKKLLMDLEFEISLDNLDNRREYLRCLGNAYDCQKLATMSITNHFFNMSRCLDITKMCHDNRRNYLLQYEKYNTSFNHLSKYINDK